MWRPEAHPLWRAAPFRLLRSPGWLGLLLVALTLFVGSVVAPPLFVATARATALADGLEATAGNPYGDESGDLRITWDAPLGNRAEAALRNRLSRMPSYGEPTLSAASTAQSLSSRAVADANGRQAPALLWYRDGAVEALGGEPTRDGVWLSSATAADLGLEVGDAFRIGIRQTFLGDDRNLAPVVLAGTFDTAPGTALPEALADDPEVDRWFLPIDPTRPTASAPVAIVDHATFDRLSRKVGTAPLYVADLHLDPEVTPAGAHAAVDAVDAFGDDATDPASEVYSHLATGRPKAATVSVITGLPVIVEGADGTATSADQQVGPYAVGGEVLALVLLIAAWVLLGLSRRREQLLASGLGLRPAALAGLAALEVLLACLVAVPLGVALAHLGVATAGPPTAARTPVTGEEMLRGGVAAAAALVLLAVATGVVALATDHLDRRSALGGSVSVPWGTALVATTAVVGVAVLSVDLEDRSSTQLTTVFPFLVAATVALVVLRGLGWLRRRRRLWARPGTPRWLAARRSGPVVREVYALSGVVAVALGLFAYTLTVQRGIDEGVADKAAALSGSASSIEVDNDLRGQGKDRAVSPPVEDSTVVWSRGVSLPPVYGDVPILAIDPATFADVADWGGSGDLEAGRALVPQLASRHGKGLPVILAGDTDRTAGDQAVLDLMSESMIPADIIGVVPAFPGSERETGATTVIVDSNRLFRLVGRTPPVIDPRKRGATRDDPGSFTSTVWSGRSVADLRSQLSRADVETDGAVTTAAQARIDNGLIASTWAAGYVLALGAVALALALAAGLVLVLRLAERDTVSDVLLRRMGYAAGDLARARAWEVGYAVAAGVLAAAIATAVLVLGPSTIDAVAGIPPQTRPRVDLVDAIALVVVLLVLVLVAWLVGTVLARRRPAAEVLRAGE